MGRIEEKCVFFADDESLLDTRRMGVLADLIRKAGIEKRYFLYGRSDTVAKHPDLIEQWKKVGLERVFVGLEFMRDADLKLLRKGSTAENNKTAVKVLRSLGIDIRLYLAMHFLEGRSFRHFARGTGRSSWRKEHE